MTPLNKLRCPQCGQEEVRRSRRSRLEHLLAIFRLYPYRCEVCDKRFFSFTRFLNLGELRG